MVAAQTGSGTITVNGGTLTVDGDAPIGFVGSGLLSVTAGGVASVTGTLDLGAISAAAGTLTVDGNFSTLTATGGLTIGDVGSGVGTISGGASVGFSGALIVGNFGTGALTVGAGSAIGTAGQGMVEIGAGASGNGGITLAGAGAALNGNALLVGGNGAGAAGNGMLSIGLGAGATMSTATVWSAGAVLLSGGSLSANQITVGGAVTGFGALVGGLVDNGTVTVTGGALAIAGGISGSGILGFSGVGSLILTAPGTIGIAQAVTGLDNGDRIELGGLAINSASVSSPGTITVATASGAFKFTNVTFAGGASQVLTTGHDAVTNEDYVQVACFAGGTRILTARGEVRVEDLCVGDDVVSGFGGCVPVVWLGHRDVRCDRHPRPWEVWPVRVRKDAFGAGRPSRDLRLSPDHAVYINDVLIPIRYLVNGATVVRAPAAAVTYWHVELPAHDVILAEGLPAESYLDTGNRGAFANGGAAVALHPDFSRNVWDGEGCARLVVDGNELRAARAWLLNRAVALGHALTDEAALRLVVDGQALSGEVAGGRYRFRLPAGAGDVRLVSRGAIPAEIGIADTDARRLGVAVAGLRLDGMRIGLDDRRLTAGWHAVEAGWRWTDGDGGLAIGGGLLEVEVAMVGRYWEGEGKDCFFEKAAKNF